MEQLVCPVENERSIISNIFLSTVNISEIPLIINAFWELVDMQLHQFSKHIER